MNKKITIGLAVLILLLGGGYFFANSLNREIEELAQNTLKNNNIQTEDVKYNIFSQSLSLKNVTFVYSHNSMKMDNKADEILVKGISKDNFIASAGDDALVCDEIEFKNLTSRYYAYDNEELETVTENISIAKPMLNIRQLLTLHKSAPFSEEYFQCLLDTKHDGIKIANLKMQAFKGSESQAVISIKNTELPPYNGEKFDMVYSGFSVTSPAINFDIAEILLEGVELPDAKSLAVFSKTAVRLNELERSGVLEDDPESFIEYENLSNQLLEQLAAVSATPFSTVKISDSRFYFNEIEQVAKIPVILKELSYKFDENDKELVVTSSLKDLTIAKEYLNNLASPACNTLIAEKFAQGLVIGGQSTASFSKETGEFFNDGMLSVPTLAEISAKAEGIIPSKDKNAFLFNLQKLGAELSEDELFKVLEDTQIKGIEVRYDDKGLIDFSYQILSAETGLPKENIKQASLTQLEQTKSFMISQNSENIDKDIAKIIDTLIQTIDKTGKFFAKISFDPACSLADILLMEKIPAYTLDAKAE